MGRIKRPRRMALFPLLIGLLLGAASLTPSLIPRDWFLQGVLAGIAIALGYMLTQFVLTLWRSLGLPVMRGRAALIAHFIAALPVIITGIFCILHVTEWQNSIRERMTLPPLEEYSVLGILAVAVVTFLAFYLIGHLIQSLFDLLRGRLARYIPVNSANVLGLLLAALVILIITRDGVVNQLLKLADSSYAAAQSISDPSVDAPTNDWQSGSAKSLIDWGLMGKPGRNFVLGGPTAADIAKLNGRPAKEPLRIYVGLAQDNDAKTRAQIAFDEMLRVGAFDRKVLVVASPTGTGWMDPASYDVLEYMLDGDVATVSAQYSYLQSPLALIFETNSGLDQATALMHLVYNHWASMPADQRPQLYMHGISLGAWSSMYAFNVFQMMNEPIDGALWVGPPFPSTLWKQANDARSPNSPYILPEVDDGIVIRYASQYAKPLRSGKPWGRVHLLFLQHASDPIVFFSPSALWREPIWMREPKAPDVSPLLSFTPIVTQLQLTVDLLLSTSPPPGFGHTYSAQDYVDAWSAVIEPPNWTDAEAAKLKAHCGIGEILGCENGS